MSGRGFTASEIVALLKADTNELSGWWPVRGELPTRDQVFIWRDSGGSWVKADGSYVTGWREHNFHAQHFGGWGAWRIRCAVRRWAKRRGL